MGVIYLLISVSLIMAIVFFAAFVKAVKSGQYQDDYTPSVRMLFDDELLPTATDKENLTELKQE
ncbi:MAG: cbb3-type cytochrome oxidase assembly protein CcoS [Flavobacterium sp.]|nr:cbb3-type cytochrome oxidase assembly protein CcoS [Flavobacterium sp.]